MLVSSCPYMLQPATHLDAPGLGLSRISRKKRKLVCFIMTPVYTAGCMPAFAVDACAGGQPKHVFLENTVQKCIICSTLLPDHRHVFEYATELCLA